MESHRDISVGDFVVFHRKLVLSDIARCLIDFSEVIEIGSELGHRVCAGFQKNKRVAHADTADVAVLVVLGELV